MKCPDINCDSQESKIVKCKWSSDQTTKYRRRECLKCGTRYNTSPEFVLEAEYKRVNDAKD